MLCVYKNSLDSNLYLNYNPENLGKSHNSVKFSKLSFRKAGLKFNILKSTLENNVTNTNPQKIGGQKMLTHGDEIKFIHSILRAAFRKFFFTLNKARYIVKSFLYQSGCKEKRFVNNMLSKAVLFVRLSENIK